MYEISLNIFLVERNGNPFLTVNGLTIFVPHSQTRSPRKRYSVMNCAPITRSFENDRYFTPQTLESYTKVTVAEGERKRKSANSGKIKFQKRDENIICLKFNVSIM